MNAHKAVSLFLLALVALIIIGTVWAIFAYSGTVLSSFVSFIATSDFARLQQCGITPPATVEQLKSDLPLAIVPFVYMGVPLILVTLPLLAFIAGSQHEKWRIDEIRERAHRREERLADEHKHSRK